VLPTRNEKANLELLFPLLDSVLKEIGVPSETIVVDGDSVGRHSGNGQTPLRAWHSSRKERDTGVALKQGFKAASGKYIVTLDADLSHEPKFIQRLWENRDRADVVVASRYCEGGGADAPLFRRFLSNVLNWFFTLASVFPFPMCRAGFDCITLTWSRQWSSKVQLTTRWRRS
jgi:dolichol-phosphate mannosyltransferase